MMTDPRFTRVSRITKALLMEGPTGTRFNTKKLAPGVDPFKSSTVADPHIRAVVNEISHATGVPTQLIDAEMDKYIKTIEEVHQYSPKLYDTMVKNIAETAAFNQIKHIREYPGTHTPLPRFNERIFRQLCRMVEREHPGSFFPLRKPGEVRGLEHINPIVVPSRYDAHRQYNSITTACATPDAKFVFNREFMQDLMNWSSLTGHKPKDPKYQSNGGPIPDAYAHIEFVIIHELLHYSTGDFDNAKRLPQYSMKSHNWAMDFRSNHLLVKSGYDQLPMGLFSHAFNFDQQKNYRELIAAVQAELDKLPKPLQDKVNEMTKTDEHPPQEGDPGDQSQPGDQGDQPGDQGDQQGNGPGKPGDQGDQQGKGPGKPGDQEDQPGDPTNETGDDRFDDIDKKLERRKEEIDRARAAGERPVGPKAPNKRPKSSSHGGPGNSAMSDLASRKAEFESITPTKSWRKVLRNMIIASIPDPEDTYTKQSRAGIAQQVQVLQRGVGAVKPGERDADEPIIKLAFVFDTSGSMWDAVPKVLRNARDLLRSVDNRSPVTVTFFAAGTPKYYVVDMNGGSTGGYKEIQNFDMVVRGKQPPGAKIKPWEGVFHLGGSGGTDFNHMMAEQLGKLASAGWNILLFSDSDMTWGGNLDNLFKLWKAHSNHVFVILKDEPSYQAVATAMFGKDNGITPSSIQRSMTHMGFNT